MIMRVEQVGMFHTNCYLVGDEKSGVCAIFDPGAHKDKILKMAEEAGLKITTIILTHCHFDHVSAAHSLQEATGAEVMIHEDDIPYLAPEKVYHPGYVRENYKTPVIGRVLRDGDEIALGELTLRVVHTPGHTLGSCIFLVEDVMISGDTLFKDACGRWDLEGGCQESMMDSLAKIHDLDGDWRVFSGHSAPTTLEQERRSNHYMKMGLLQRESK